MRAVNLIPEELRPRVPGDGDPKVAYGVLGALAVLLLMVIVSIHFANKLHTIEDQTAAITAEAQSHRTKVAAVSTTPDEIAADVKTRTLLVGGLAKTRFPWGDALYDLSRAIPSDTTLNAINVTSGTSSSAGGGASSSGSTMELTGCTSSWVGYSRFMTWLKTMPGVDTVESTSSAISSATSDSTSVNRTKNCGPAPLTFALNVDYSPRKIDLLGLPKPDVSPAAGASGATGAVPAGTPAASTTPTPAPAPAPAGE
jgi:Tfp pilus assembly protein PilN